MSYSYHTCDRSFRDAIFRSDNGKYVKFWGRVLCHCSLHCMHHCLSSLLARRRWTRREAPMAVTMRPSPQFQDCVYRPSGCLDVDMLPFVAPYDPYFYQGLKFVSHSIESYGTWLAVWLSGNALASINVVVLRQTWLVPGSVTVYGRVNHFGI